MKRNIFLRLAVCLLLAAVMGTSVFTVSLAKYVAAADSAAEARVAKFSFLPGSKKYNQSGGDWEDNSDVDTGSFPYYNQIAVEPGKVTTFEVPCFDYEYFGRPDWPQELDATVQGRDDAFVAAPGTGTMNFNRINLGMHNPNFGGDGYESVTELRNDSEVAVKYRVTLDSSSAIPGRLVMKAGNSEFFFSVGPEPYSSDTSRNDNPALPIILTNINNDGTLNDNGWIMLEPNGTRNFKFSWAWGFDYSGVYSWDPFLIGDRWLLTGWGRVFDNGANTDDVADTFDDELDTLLGYYAAEYLRALEAEDDIAAEAALAECQFNLVFKLEVEQID